MSFALAFFAVYNDVSYMQPKPAKPVHGILKTDTSMSGFPKHNNSVKIAPVQIKIVSNNSLCYAKTKAKTAPGYKRTKAGRHYKPPFCPDLPPLFEFYEDLWLREQIKAGVVEHLRALQC